MMSRKGMRDIKADMYDIGKVKAFATFSDHT
jgi:hypothetical protein